MSKKLNKELEESSSKSDEKREKGFELIKEFVEKYPNTKYPTVDDDLVELFMNGARALGFHYIVCVGDDTFCPHCKEKHDKPVSKKRLALSALIGNNTICNYCYVEEWQDKEWHDTATCDHESGKGLDWMERCEKWRKEDCMAVLEAYEHSYKAVLKDQGWN